MLPDGIGLRNFVFTGFPKIGKEQGYEIVYWNNTLFDLKALKYNECKIQNAKTHPFTDILKTAKIQIGLNQFIKKTKDEVYDTYRFPLSGNSFKSKVKNFITNAVIRTFNSEKGLEKVSNQIKKLERQTPFYQQCLKTLQEEKPEFVFCSNQRHVNTIAPLLAAQDLRIPTATFIFSWDNLPKATMIVEADYYFVWSDFMKAELLFYYPYIKPEQVVVTGTPQFEAHFNKALLLEKGDFFKQYGLDSSKKYICFSGDDVTTSPDDEFYLEEVAKSIRSLNEKGANLGLIFRRSPVDFSDRYDPYIKEYSDIIVSIDPLWKQFGETWNTVMPTAEDLKLQVNIIENCILVINMASSMVFDFAAFKKPCFYINFDVKNKKNKTWSSSTIYNFVHFRSMPVGDPVFWIKSADEIAPKIEMVLNGDAHTEKVVQNAQKWFDIINQHPPQLASERIWNAISSILKKKL